jgi:uncharacterized LabA/DUF88 family protein
MRRERPIGVVPFERIAIFIDGWNFARVTRDWLKKEVDFWKLLNYFARDALILRAFYYIGEEVKEEERRKEHTFITWLRRNGYKVITKPIKVFVNDKGEEEKKADFDVDMAIDMFDLADRVDRIVLFSGDGDFTKLIDRIGMRGIRTQVVAYWGRGRGPLAPELMEAADEFIDLEDIIDDIAKT